VTLQDAKYAFWAAVNLPPLRPREASADFVPANPRTRTDTALVSRSGSALLSLSTAVCFSLISCFQLSFSQATYSLAGTVTDSITAKPIPHVAVLIAGTTLGCSTDSSGNYELSGIPRTAQTVLLRHLGYYPVTRALTVSPDDDWEILDVSLSPRAIPLPGVTVMSEFRQIEAVRDSAYKRWAQVAVTGVQLEEEHLLDFDEFLHRHCPLAENQYDLFVDGIRTDVELRDVVQFRNIKAIFIWKNFQAPPELRLRPEKPLRLEARPIPILGGMTPIVGNRRLEQFKMKPYIVLIQTK